MNSTDVGQLNAADASGLRVGRAAASGEQAYATGKYIAIMTGPLEAFRERYIELRDEIAAIEAKSWLARIMKNAKLEDLRSQISAIPLETKWADEVQNLVTTVGGNAMLDNHLSGSAYTAAWYIGLMSATGYTSGAALADTMSSHSGWTEDTNYSNGARPTAAWSAASAKSKSLSAGLVFNMNGTSTIKGCFLVSNSTVGGTTGVLFSAGLFTGGDQPVVNGNTLTVSYTASV